MKKQIFFTALFLAVVFFTSAETSNYTKVLKQNGERVLNSLQQFYSDKEPVVAIVPSKDYSSDEKELYSVIENEMQKALIDAGVTIISPSRRGVLLEELKFSLSGLTDNSSAIKVGKMLNITTFLFIKIEFKESNTWIYLELVDVETDKIITVGKIVLKKIDDPLKAKNLLLGSQIKFYLNFTVPPFLFSPVYYPFKNYPLELNYDKDSEAAMVQVDLILSFELGIEYFYKPSDLLFLTLKLGASLPNYKYRTWDKTSNTELNIYHGGSVFNHLGLTMGYGHLFPLSDFLGIIFKTGAIVAYDWNNSSIGMINGEIATDTEADFSKGVAMAGGKVETGIRFKTSTNTSISVFFGYQAYLPVELPLIPQFGKVFPNYPVVGIDTSIVF